MKKQLIACICAAGLALPAAAQSVTIYKTNGESIKYNVEEVEKIIFKPAQVFDPTNLLSEEYMPCEAFRDWIDENLGDGSGYFSLEEAAEYDGEIDLSRLEKITDITGIEYFTGLTVLKAEDGYFGDFDVSALKSLEYLQLINTKVTKLDFTGLENLRKVAVNRNQLTQLNLAQNPILESLICDSNQLTELDLTGCTGLKTLVCSFNQISALDLPECPLQTFAAHKNPISSIDLSKVVKTLDMVNLIECKLTSLDLSGASKLTYVECGDNPYVSAPILTGCTRLETLRMEHVNTVDCGEMDFTDATKLNVLRLDYSNIGTKIDLSKNKKLYELSLQGCGLREINLAGLINLGYVNVSDNAFSRLDVSAADGIYSLFANRNSRNAEIKVWPDFKIADPESQGFYIDENIRLVHEFSE